ncbi:MAG TPA: aldose epimerase [Oscillatoriaceae cyanobacterium M7585_C2015_266]|nr:aldose epimerase [Oscillatoriaceae cyanobacterium M7585_C2015_266]
MTTEFYHLITVFAIAVRKQQYKTYILTDSASKSRLEVVPERGGMITTWQVKGQDILYMERQRFANPELSVRGGIPILFPICGNLPNNTYIHKGRKYTLKQHGFARDLPWEVAEQVTQDKASITLVLNSNNFTRSVYPFDFQLVFTYTLKGEHLDIRQRYTNYSEEPMPFSTGLHPYFATLDKSHLRFEIPAIKYTDQKSQTSHPYNGTFDFAQDEIDAAFTEITGLSASVYDFSRRLRITISYNSAYSTVVFWTLKGKNFYCLEPWTAPRNALNIGKPLIQLQPGASCETFVRMSVKYF